MTFLAPIVLLAGAALAVPLLLHLFRKRESSIQSFPALRYLQRTTRDRARIIRLRQLLLLALRLAAVALVALAGARLVLPLGGTDHPPAAVALVVDNGIGASMVVEERRVLDHLADQALRALDRMGADDRVWLVAAGEPWRPARPLTPDEARRQVATLETTESRPDLPSAVARARSLLESATLPVREILVLSTLDAEAFGPDAGPEPAGDIRTVLGTVHAELPANRAVARVSVGGGLPPRAELPSEISVEVVGEPRGGQALRVHVDGELATAGRTDDQGWALLDLPPRPAGWIVGRVELDPDDLRADDLRHFALPVRPAPRIRAPTELPVHLATALEVLAHRDRIVMARQADPTESPTQAVGVEAGGEVLSGRSATLVFAPSDPARLPAVNRRLGELDAGWRLEASVLAEAPMALDSSDPALRLPDELEVRRSHGLTPGQGGRRGRVLARLADGSPWIVHIPGEATAEGAPEGEAPPSLVIVASPPDRESSDLPTSAAMIPFLSAALELLDGAHGASELTAGTPIALPEDAAYVSTPAGTRLPVGGTSSFLETGRAGVYDIRGPDDDLLGRVAVNPAAPSGAARLTPDEAARRLGTRAIATGSAREWARAALGERTGREFWRPLLLALLLVLVAEGWLASRGTPDPNHDTTSDRTWADPTT